MSGDQPRRKVLEIGKLGRDGQGFEVASAVQQLILEREVAQQRLVERLGLLGQGLDRRGSPPQKRPDDVGKTAKLTDRLLYGLGSTARIRRVPRQLTLDRFGTRPRDARLGDLNLCVGQLVKRTQLRQHRRLV